MHNRLIYCLSILFLLSPVIIRAQKRTFSPYSRYGLGEMNYSGFAQNTAMGNSGIALRNSYHLNNLNPASYTALDTMSFFLETGIKNINQEFEGNGTTTTYNDVNFDYLAFAFPISNRIYSSIGLLPMSNTGYNIISEQATVDGGNQTSYAVGSGSINKIYWGLAIRPLKNLSAGIHMNFLFGNLKNINYIDDPNSSLDKIYGKMTETHIADLLFDYGLQYRLNINNQQSFILGAVFTPKTPLRGDRSVLIAEVNDINSEGDIYLKGDTISYTSEKFTNNVFELPMSLGFGVTYQIEDKLICTADYKIDKWGDANMSFYEASDAWRLSAGVEYLPNNLSPRNYMSRIRYRAGVHYSKDYLSTDQFDYLDKGLSIGIGLPLKRSKSSINLGYEFGKRGTGNNSQLQETYHKISFNVTLHEFWFMKSKFE